MSFSMEVPLELITYLRSCLSLLRDLICVITLLLGPPLAVSYFFSHSGAYNSILSSLSSPCNKHLFLTAYWFFCLGIFDPILLNSIVQDPSPLFPLALVSFPITEGIGNLFTSKFPWPVRTGFYWYSLQPDGTYSSFVQSDYLGVYHYSDSAAYIFRKANVQAGSNTDVVRTFSDASTQTDSSLRYWLPL